MVKTFNAIKIYEQICSGKILAVAGGVAANKYLKNFLKSKVAQLDYSLIAPPTNLCTDNAAMIAYAGLERFEAGSINELNFCPRARWSLEDLKV